MFGLVSQAKFDRYKEFMARRLEIMEEQVFSESKKADRYLILGSEDRTPPSSATLKGKVEAILRHLGLDAEVSMKPVLKPKKDEKESK